ncbi:MAG: OadG family protein [Sulfurospirillum sp.]|nr:OadG family protein [Sulfurospirillum sp.]
MEVNLVVEGLKFMVLGMGTVFLFLILMVFVLQLQAIVITKFFPQKIPPTPLNQSAKKTDNKALVAAITAAIQTYKNSK